MRVVQHIEAGLDPSVRAVRITAPDGEVITYRITLPAALCGTPDSRANPGFLFFLGYGRRVV